MPDRLLAMTGSWPYPLVTAPPSPSARPLVLATAPTSAFRVWL